MKKIYVQEIERQGQVEKFPGPDKYELPKTFGTKGIHFTMRPDVTRRHDNLLLKKKSLMPGPGSYKEIDVVGNTNSMRLTSVNRTPIANTFARTQNRFNVPSKNFRKSTNLITISIARKIPGTREPHTKIQLY